MTVLFQREFTRAQRTVLSSGEGVLESLVAQLTGDGVLPHVMVDPVVLRRHASILQPLLELAGDAVLEIDAGEGAKSPDALLVVLRWLRDSGALRRGHLVVVGGSTLTDLGGLAAALYLRGLPYSLVPTTLLAQLDGAYGGKVGINDVGAKNVYGTFWHPARVLLEPAFLSSLAPRQLAAGLAEAAKVACLDGTGDLLDLLVDVSRTTTGFDPALLGKVVRQSLVIKDEFLSHDPFEADLRRPLNLGHEVAHALEAAGGFRSLEHGEAVAVGLCTAFRLGSRLGLTDPLFAKLVEELLVRLGLPTSVAPGDVAPLLAHLDAIRRVRDGALLFVVPTRIGDVAFLDDVDSSQLVLALLGGSRDV